MRLGARLAIWPVAGRPDTRSLSRPAGGQRPGQCRWSGSFTADHPKNTAPQLVPRDHLKYADLDGSACQLSCSCDVPRPTPKLTWPSQEGSRAPAGPSGEGRHEPDLFRPRRRWPEFPEDAVRAGRTCRPGAAAPVSRAAERSVQASSFASVVTSAFNTLETGHPFFAVAAADSKACWPAPGTLAVTSR